MFNEVGTTMDLNKLFLVFTVLTCGHYIFGQEIDLTGSTLGIDDIPVRVPPSHFQFNKNRQPPGISKRIIGGDVATAHQYPFQAALYVQVGSSLYFCGGSLITTQWVLTAAHCVEGAASVVVILGGHDLSTEEESRIVLNSSTFIIHENWDSTMILNDVALIRLPKTVTLTDEIGVISLASGTNSYEGITSRCLGWGITLLGALSNVLRYVDAPVITNDNCSSYTDYSQYIQDQHLCTSGEGIVGSCNGDSGGPLLIDGIQVGIVSFGAADCAAGLPSVYARVTEFNEWITSTIGSNSDGNEVLLTNYSGKSRVFNINMALVLFVLVSLIYT